ncbi:hypothetical protein [Streptomyces sp. NBC_01373]|uniref:hypothetical protein n=1 Tax=Streptomyces sp. NBC_01373 TaxID=2903843 RepID=UPI00225087B5|nr:hypothetical protein [Streptomyces sp. NBC_01373]MCX4703888.1 hypothetical protein [Streptomyces sp. NBC_01373]
MSRYPEGDELRIQTLMRQHGVGPNAVPPKPTARPRDWLDEILTSPPAEPTPAPEPEPEAEPVEKTKTKPKGNASRRRKRRKRKRPGPDTPRSAFDSRPASPRQSLLDAWDQVPYRLKWLAYHASAAYLGWSIGLVGWVTYVTAWIADTGPVGVQATFWYSAAAATFVLHHRTRGWWKPAAWLAAVPATSVVVGVLLHGAPNL